jgi:DNA-binding response OmpR family regulator
MNDTPNVLVVDDRSELCEVLQGVLIALGFEVHCASNGPEAISILDTERIDLAIIDLLLPGALSGDDVATDAASRGVKVITMSGALSSDRRGRDLRYAHLLKPVRLADLIAAVNTALPRRPTR